MGYTPGEWNSVDYMTNLFPDPCSIINSDMYRFGDPVMKDVGNLEKDTGTTCTAGVLKFLGIPERFLSKN